MLIRIPTLPIKPYNNIITDEEDSHVFSPHYRESDREIYSEILKVSKSRNLDIRGYLKDCDGERDRRGVCLENSQERINIASNGEGNLLINYSSNPLRQEPQQRRQKEENNEYFVGMSVLNACSKEAVIRFVNHPIEHPHQQLTYTCAC